MHNGPSLSAKASAKPQRRTWVEQRPPCFTASLPARRLSKVILLQMLQGEETHWPFVVQRVTVLVLKRILPRVSPPHIIPPLRFKAWTNDLSQLVMDGSWPTEPKPGSWRPCPPESPSWLGTSSTPHLFGVPIPKVVSSHWEVIARGLPFIDPSER